MTIGPSPLDGANHLLVEKVPLILAEMAALGHPMKMTEGRRSLKRQQDLYAQGRTKPGSKVTNCDGVKNKSKHQAQSDGTHHAIDFVFILGMGRVTWKGPWDVFGALVRKHGLKWGGDWTTPDRPHVEV